MRSRLGRLVWLTMAMWLLVVPAANAYIDPGSTTVIFQAIIAGIAAAGMGLRMFWGRISGFFRRDKGDTGASAVARDE